MTYTSVVVMAASGSLKQRITAAAAEQNVPTPPLWAEQNIWHVVSTDGWAAAWDYATDSMTINDNPDIGARNDVINDQMIKDAVYTLLAEQATAP